MNIEEQITAAWYSVLSGQVTVGSYTFPIYRTNAPIGENGHYVLLRKESGSPEWNKTGSFRRFTLIVEVVTRFQVVINDKLVDDADEIIKGLVFTSPQQNNLGVTGLLKVDYGTPIWLDEDNGSTKIYRKITRFNHQINN